MNPGGALVLSLDTLPWPTVYSRRAIECGRGTLARVTIRLNLGPGATLGAVASVVDNLTVIHDLGLRVDAIVARRDAAATVEDWWRNSPGQIYERSLSLGETSSARLQQLLQQRERDDYIQDRLASTPPELWFEEWYQLQRRYLGKGSPRRFVPPPLLWSSLRESNLADVAPDLFARLVADEVGRHLPPTPAVERLAYENPVEVILIGVGLLTGAGFKFGTFTDIAKLIRDWSADKDENRARAREAAAVADQAEIRVRRERAEVERTEAETRELHARASKAEVEAEILRRYALQGNDIDDLVAAGLAPQELEAMAQLSAGSVEVEVDENGP